MKNNDIHLNEDHIIRAIVDENDLTASERDHLLQCALCQKEKQEFGQLLNRMGDMTKELVPSPPRRFMSVAKRSRISFSWQPALVGGFVIALLMIGIWWSSLFTRFQENGSMHITQKIESDQQVVGEISLVEDYALPDRYLYIIGTSYEDDYDDYDTYDDYNDYENYYDDELLESVIPL